MIQNSSDYVALASADDSRSPVGRCIAQIVRLKNDLNTYLVNTLPRAARKTCALRTRCAIIAHLSFHSADLCSVFTTGAAGRRQGERTLSAAEALQCIRYSATASDEAAENPGLGPKMLFSP